MKTIVLHIGYPKTGTSSIQWFLNGQRKRLLQQGVCFPTTGQSDDHAHHGLAVALGANANPQSSRQLEAKLFDALEAEIEECGAETVVLSSELLLGNLGHVERSDRLARLLQDSALRLVCVVRKQSTFLESLYYQFIWDPNIRFSRSVDAFLEEYPWAGDYHSPLTMWAAWGGKDNLTTLVYEQAQHSGGLVKRFCEVAGIDTVRLGRANFDVRRQVSRVPALATQMMRAGNGYTHLFPEQWNEFATSVRTFARATGHLALPHKLFTDDEIAHVEARFLESNQKLAADFVRQPLDGAWFRENPSSAADPDTAPAETRQDW